MNKILRFIRRSKYGWFDLILTVGVALRVVGLDNYPVWYDEAWTVLLSKLPISQMVAATAADVHPPLYYLIASLLPNVYAIRLFSLVCSALSILFIWMLTAKQKQSTRITAVLLMALAPVQIYYAQEARSYAMLEALVLAAMLLLQKRNWLALGIVNTAILYTHNYGLFYVVVISLLALGGELLRPVIIPPDEDQSGRARIKQALLSGLIPAVLFIPWAVVLYGQIRFVAGGFWIQPITVGGTVYALEQIIFGMQFPGAFYLPIVIGMMWGITSALFTAAKSKQALFEAAMFIMPIGMVVVVSVFYPILLFRGLIGVLPSLYVLVASGITSAPKASRQLAIGFLVVIGLVGMFYGIGDEFGYQKRNREIASPAVIQKDDLVVHLNDFSILTWMVKPPAKIARLQTDCPNEPGALSPAARVALAMPSIDKADLPTDGYYFVAALGPHSSSCDVAQVRGITSGQTLIYLRENELTMEGVWYVDR